MLGVSGIPKTMRAVVYRGVNDLRVETVPVPRIGANELLVKVAVCGVCPTDIKKIHYGTVKPPRIFGHETSGIVAAVGEGVQTYRPGDRETRVQVPPWPWSERTTHEGISNRVSVRSRRLLPRRNSGEQSSTARRRALPQAKGEKSEAMPKEQRPSSPGGLT